jgi:hypothetical protein
LVGETDSVAWTLGSRSAAEVGVQLMRIYDAEHLFQAGVHFFFPNELAAVGLCDALSDGDTEAGILLKQAQSGILHQSLGISACLGGNLRKCASCSGVKCTSIAFKLRQSLHRRNTLPRRCMFVWRGHSCPPPLRLPLPLLLVWC